MRSMFTFLALACCTNLAVAQPAEKKVPLRIGKIYITGNEVTQDRVILGAMGLYPGQTLTIERVRQAEKKLRRLGFFANNKEDAPNIKILGANDEVFKDLLVSVKETRTDGWILQPLTASLALTEINFDLWRSPRSLADIWEGRAFHGAGMRMEFRVSLVRTNLLMSMAEELALWPWRRLVQNRR